MPRQYDMSKRSAAVEATRRRIVEATAELHNSHGVLDTTWEQIAARADVAPATVYRHFPNLDVLLPACGELVMARLRLPDDERIAEVFAGADERRERIARLVAEVFALYERGGDVVWAVRRDRRRVPRLQAAHERIEARIDALVDAALGDEDRRLARALLDYDAWRALTARGFGPDAVAALLSAGSHAVPEAAE
jgi:AcrR family transcriptional regulator